MKTIQILVIIILLSIIGCSENRVDYIAEGNRILASNNMDSLDYRNALKLFKTELKDNPNNTEAQLGLAQVYGRLSLPDSAILVLSNSIEKKKLDIAKLLVGKGMFRFINGDYAESIEDFKSSLKYNPQNQQSYDLIINSIIWQKYFKDNVWMNFGSEDVIKIIDEVYPANFANKPSYEKFINPKEL